ncbi:hypothetical protein V1289_000464 [Bradyrhizobium sp. AZCC 2289]
MLRATFLALLRIRDRKRTAWTSHKSNGYRTRTRDDLRTKHAPHPEDRRILQWLAGSTAQWIRRTPARMADELKIGLQRPAGTELILINRRQQSFGTAQRPGRSIELREIRIEGSRSSGDPCEGASDSELVVRPSVLKPDELDAGVAVKVDQIAIRRAVGDARKNPDAAIIVSADPINLLFEDGLDPIVAGQRRRHRSRRIGE